MFAIMTLANVPLLTLHRDWESPSPTHRHTQR